jgi:hypothetical protein
MKAPAQLTSMAAAPSISAAAVNRLPAIAIWAVASGLAAFFSLIVRDSSFVADMVLPRGNDSFYHARRILDALGTRGFYQFDDRLQAPDGAWIPWPWAYDYLMAKATQLALWIDPTLDAMAFISYVPVAWILVNAALFMAAMSVLRMSLEMRALAMICYALSPLTQHLHSVGMIDHHFVEHTFVLLNIWLGLRWFDRPDSAPRAAVLGIALGAAPAFHNGLFILQLVPLVAVFLLWLRGSAPKPRALRAFAVALLVTTQIVLLPSEAYRNGMFEFGLLSWFHLWVAICSAAVMTYMSSRPYSRAHCAHLVGLAVLLAVPFATQLSTAAGFLSAQFSMLAGITETSSPYEMLTGVFGPRGTADWYSWLVLLAPVLLLFYAYRSCRDRSPRDVYYATAAVLGLALLLDQFRLYYFGFYFLVAAPLLIVEQLRIARGWHRGAVFAGMLAAVTLAYQPPLRDQLFAYYPPGANQDYATALPIFLDLREQCAADPGVVLATSDDGSPILFHSDCSVIANNFILRPEDKAHLDEIGRLLELTPAQIVEQRPDIKYLLVRTRDFSFFQNGELYLAASKPIAAQMILNDVAPAGFELVETILQRTGQDGPSLVYARLYKVDPRAGQQGLLSP